MIELTPEQRQALDERRGEPVRVLDPVTHNAYLFVREVEMGCQGLEPRTSRV